MLSSGGFHTREACDTVRYGRSGVLVQGGWLSGSQVVDSFRHDYEMMARSPSPIMVMAICRGLSWIA